jgi:hypothetical protein
MSFVCFNCSKFVTAFDFININPIEFAKTGCVVKVRAPVSPSLRGQGVCAACSLVPVDVCLLIMWMLARRACFPAPCLCRRLMCLSLPCPITSTATHDCRVFDFVPFAVFAVLCLPFLTDCSLCCVSTGRFLLQVGDHDDPADRPHHCHRELAAAR